MQDWIGSIDIYHAFLDVSYDHLTYCRMLKVSQDSFAKASGMKFLAAAD